MTTLQAAFKPHLSEANDCACPVCRAVDAQVYVTGTGKRLIRDETAYWAAISEQLRVLAASEHVRVGWADHIATLPWAPMAPQVHINSGLHLGFGSGLHDRPHPPWVPARVYDDWPDEPAPAPIAAPVQLDLFGEVAA
jgi:hypothetical protein